MRDKLGLCLATGVALLPGQERLNSNFLPQNAFGSFDPGISLNAFVLYNLSEHFVLGMDMRYLTASKAHHVLYASEIGPVLKYDLLPSNSLFVPFAMAGPRLGYLYLNRSGYSFSIHPPLPGNPSQVEVNQIQGQIGQAAFGMASIGAMIGTGAEFKASKRLNLFFLASYTFLYAGNPTELTSNYPAHKGQFNCLVGEIGLHYHLKKEAKHAKDINSLAKQDSEHKKHQSTKKVGDQAAKKTVTQKMPSHHAISPNGSRMKFKTLAKEDLDPTQQYTIDGQVKGKEGRKTEDVSILILDEKDKIVGITKTNKQGNFAYKGLKADNYTVALDKNDPRLSATAEISVEDPGLKVDAEDLNKFHYNRLPSNGKHHGIITGDAVLKDKGIAAADQIMLLLDDQGNIVQTTQTNKAGKYAFRNLKSDNYSVIAAQNPAIQANAIATGADPQLSVDPSDFRKFDFKQLHNGHQAEPVIIGKVLSPPTPKLADGQSILLLDEGGNIVSQTLANKEGLFTFKGLKGDHYQAVIPGADPSVVAKASIGATDPSLQVTKDAFYKFHKLDNENQPDNFLTGHLKLATKGPSNDDPTVLLLDADGKVVETAKVSKDGNFVFKNVRAASYQVVVDGSDYTSSQLSLSKNDPSKTSLSSTAFRGAPAQNVVVGQIQSTAQLPDNGVGLLLVDPNGTPVERAQSDKQGNFVFRNIRASDYQVIVEDTEYEKVQMVVAGTEKSEKINLSDSKDAPVKSQDHILVGKLQGTSSLLSDKTVLLLNDKGEIVGKTVTTKRGSFTFKGLKADNYQTVLAAPDPQIKTHLNTVVKDPALKLSMKDVLKYNPETKHMEPIQIADPLVITGTIRSENFVGVEDRSVLLLDQEGNIVKEATSDKSGVFSFRGITAQDYQVVYQDGEKKVHPNIQMYKDNDPAITVQGGKIAQTLFYGTNEFKLTDKDEKELLEFVHYYQQHPNIRLIKLNAYGDATGTDVANMEITQKRAEMVVKFLQANGVPADKLTVNPLGKSLKFKNKFNVPDPQLNRKVDIEIVEE